MSIGKVYLELGSSCTRSQMPAYLFWTVLDLDILSPKRRKKNYMVGLSAICWLTRNNFSFEGKLIRSPTEVICLASSFISYWAGLQKGNDKEVLESGADTLKQAALYFHQQRQDNNCMMLPCWVRRWKALLALQSEFCFEKFFCCPSLILFLLRLPVLPVNWVEFCSSSPLGWEVVCFLLWPGICKTSATSSFGTFSHCNFVAYGTEIRARPMLEKI